MLDKTVHSQNKCVLVVDDEPAINQLFAHLLRRNGYEVIQASNGQEALAQLAKASRPVSLIILDVAMPVMDGFEFRAIQRETPQIAHIPALVITSRQSFEKDIRFMKAAAYLKKPIEADLLLETVELHCLSTAPGPLLKNAA
jgi:CheY-like chemotaxis protein